MQSLRKLAVMAALGAGMLLSAAVQAHPKLVSSSPAEGSTVEAPAKIELHFSEKLLTQLSGAKLVMTEMPGMSHSSPMGVKAAVSGSVDPNVMLITPTAPLTTGTYQVQWRAISSDTHPITGAVTFKVK
ncbi:copper homeostasis periplasmic binding protein CopC [Pseudomonas sp. DCA-1]|uniref:copper homeostasis periplasmic binding protein CopC n=1 Tax=Pseudomonas sp. DCA-1 TaxID=3344874 RepID=UPI003977CDD2